MKKSLLILTLAALATSTMAQQPPLATCITNVILTLTDTNAYFDNGGGATNVAGSVVTVNINYHGCYTNGVVIGNVFLRCDQQRHCQNNENISQCPSGAIFPITLPALCDGITATFQPDGGCCSIQQINTNLQTCVPQDGSGPQP